ncbi:hypothetical protein ABZP36_031735 [Zizania latifolia]
MGKAIQNQASSNPAPSGPRNLLIYVIRELVQQSRLHKRAPVSWSLELNSELQAKLWSSILECKSWHLALLLEQLECSDVLDRLADLDSEDQLQVVFPAFVVCSC